MKVHSLCVLFTKLKWVDPSWRFRISLFGPIFEYIKVHVFGSIFEFYEQSYTLTERPRPCIVIFCVVIIREVGNYLNGIRMKPKA